MLAIGASAPAIVRAVLTSWESNAILRGQRLGEESGCLACHRPFAGDEIPNPGSRWQSVPAFQGGNAMMYDAMTRQGIEEYVRYGALQWLDEDAVRRHDTQLLRMPAYEDFLSEEEIADVVSWAAALEGVELSGGEAVDAGRAVARRHGCLSCHGLEGAGGLPNPDSLGGFIPGFLGKNFEHLVHDRDELAEWIRDGKTARLDANPIVRRVWARQGIAMPAYGDRLSDAEIDQLWAWIQAGRTPG